MVFGFGPEARKQGLGLGLRVHGDSFCTSTLTPPLWEQSPKKPQIAVSQTLLGALTDEVKQA